MIPARHTPATEGRIAIALLLAMAIAQWSFDDQSGLAAGLLALGWAVAAISVGYTARSWALVGVPVAVVIPVLLRHGLALGLESEQSVCDPSCGISPGGEIVLLIPLALALAGIGALLRLIVSRSVERRVHDR